MGSKAWPRLGSRPVNQISRRSFILAGAALAGGGTVLGSCSSSTASTPGARASKPGAPGVATGPPRRGGTLRMGTFSEVDGFDPTSSEWDTTGYLYGECVFDPLAAFAPDGSAKPYLAESIVPSSDYSSWTITLRPGVFFHDGTALDAEALHLNLTRQIASPLVGPALQNVAAVNVTGSLSVEVQMHSPWVPFIYYLADQPGYIAAPSMLDNPNGSSQPVGTGPFVFESWEPGTRFVARKNPRYWRNGLPYLDAVEFRPFADPASMSASLLSGALDAATTTDQSTILYFSKQGRFVVVDDRDETIVQPDQNCIMLNVTKPPVDDIRVRQALAYSIDRQAVVDYAFSGLGAVSEGPFVAGSRWFAPTGYPSLDLQKARDLVRAYSADHGPVHLTLGIPSGNPTYTQVAELVQAMWKKVGISSSITQSEYSTYVAEAALGDFVADGDQQFGANDPDENYVWWSTDTLRPDGEISLNITRNADPRIQAALLKGRESPDLATRQSAYQAIGRYLAEDLPYLWINRSVSAVVATLKVQNFNATTFPDGSPGQGVSGGTFRFSTTWLS